MQWLMGRWRSCRLVGSQWVGGIPAGGSVVGGWWVGSNMVGRLVVGGSVEDLSVGRWQIVGGRWPVGCWGFVIHLKFAS